jgi:DMSO/TMAO reductase YedYZ molybdopterin-dependent catalytic subunit
MLKDKPFKPIIEELIGRRSALEWLGKGTVLALSGKWLGACSLVDEDTDVVDTGPPREDNGDGTVTLDTDPPSCDFAFTPGQASGSVFENWGERTVESEELLSELGSWKLIIDGLVKNPLTLTFDQLAALPRTDMTADFHCVEGWTIADVPWNGVPMGYLLGLAEPLPSATHLTVHSVNNLYVESIPLSVAKEPQTLLAYGIDCNTIPKKHGFPARLVIPRKWAYKSSKYVYRLELDDRPRTGYWEMWGYPYDADVAYKRLKAASLR